MKFSHFLSPILIASIILLIIAEKAYAFKFTAKICEEYNLGKNWYCEEKEENKDDKDREVTANDILSSSILPEEKAVKINELWELQRKRAVITGEKKDLEKFLETQFIIAQKGVDFARNIQLITESNPKWLCSGRYELFC